MKRPYTSPKLCKYERPSHLPSHLQQAAQELLVEIGALSTIIDRDRRFISVSEGFASLLGYRIMDIVGRRVDDFTEPGSIDIESVFKTFFKVGELDGLWMFRHCDGRKVVVNYHARLSEDQSYANLRPLLVA